jgi:hypothetical protein
VLDSPWFERLGASGTFTCDTIDIGGSGTLDIVVEHKNRADTAESTASAFSTISATGLASHTATGLKELVRFRYNIDGVADTDWVLRGFSSGSRCAADNALSG